MTAVSLSGLAGDKGFKALRLGWWLNEQRASDLWWSNGIAASGNL